MCGADLTQCVLKSIDLASFDLCFRKTSCVKKCFFEFWNVETWMDILCTF